jgi:D-alanyl-lipoteichoic acid acyltransferase DltB (MBOAT superfamily)
MVFSSLEFIYLFLPVTLAGFFLLRRFDSERGIIAWLIAASLFFYGWWNPWYLVLLIGSVLINYGLHRVLSQLKDPWVLGLGIAANLLVLAYYKYADFFISNVNALTGLDYALAGVALPLAISFFTFQQISFLYDTYRGDLVECDFPRYALFIVFFPQLIAGPIVLQKDTIPQFTLSVFKNRMGVNLSVGLTLFVIGLFKKIVLADGLVPYVSTAFSLAETTEGVPVEAAWIGALAYTFQIYFDFSGYCDMALGVARMFGIRLPINFNSPYKSKSIVEFWRRWHITLSRFLRDYLYIPLGGSRRGAGRRHLNLMATMALGGLWHGASWTFVVWGGLHGLYLVVNHTWSRLWGQSSKPAMLPAWLSNGLAQAVTLLAVIVAWVFFRAESFGGASNIIAGMSGLSQPLDPKLWASLSQDTLTIWLHLAALTAIVFLLPNSIEIARRYGPVLADGAESVKNSAVGQHIAWRPSPAWAATMGLGFFVALVQLYRLEDITEFIYFNF